MEGLRGDLSNLTSQLEDLKVVITQSEGEAAEKLEALQREHKKLASEFEEKLKKAESAREKVEKSKEEAIHGLNAKVKEAISDKDEAVQKLKSEVAGRQVECDQLKERLADVEKSQVSASAESSAAVALIKRKCSDLEGRLEKLTAEKEALESELGEKVKEAERLNGVDSELKSMKEGKDKAEGDVLELKRNVEVSGIRWPSMLHSS